MKESQINIVNAVSQTYDPFTSFELGVEKWGQVRHDNHKRQISINDNHPKIGPCRVRFETVLAGNISHRRDIYNVVCMNRNFTVPKECPSLSTFKRANVNVDSVLYLRFHVRNLEWCFQSPLPFALRTRERASSVWCQRGKRPGQGCCRCKRARMRVGRIDAWRGLIARTCNPSACIICRIHAHSAIAGSVERLALLPQHL